MKEVINRFRQWLPTDFSGLAEGSRHRILEKKPDGWYWEVQRLPATR